MRVTSLQSLNLSDCPRLQVPVAPLPSLSCAAFICSPLARGSILLVLCTSQPL